MTIAEAVKLAKEQGRPDALLKLTKEYSTPEGQRIIREAISQYEREQGESQARDRSNRESYLKDIEAGRYDGFC